MDENVELGPIQSRPQLSCEIPGAARQSDRFESHFICLAKIRQRTKRVMQLHEQREAQVVVRSQQ